jgi:hypothetical protein
MACINSALDLLQSPRWETPEQWEKRTGEKWPDDWAVYWRYSEIFAYKAKEWIPGKELVPVYYAWDLEFYGPLKEKYSSEIYDDRIDIVCATEAGPPPDDWKPEEDECGRLLPAAGEKKSHEK